MKIKKTVTDKVAEANRENAKKATGPKTEKGKETVSRNAVKHGVLARKLHFSDQEATEYKDLMSDLKHRIDRDDPFQWMLAQELGSAFMRRARALGLESALYKRQNPATEIAFKTIENSELVDAGIFLPDPNSGWDCAELAVAASKEGDYQHKKGDESNGNGDGRQIRVHARFQDPLERVLRYQRATARDFYTALNRLERLRRNPEKKRERNTKQTH